MTYDRTPLSKDELSAFLTAHPRWEVDGVNLVRTFEMKSFARGIAFVVRIGDLAEAEDHHPDIDIRYRNVTLRLTTHATGGLTFRDPKLAALIDAAFEAEDQ